VTNTELWDRFRTFPSYNITLCVEFKSKVKASSVSFSLFFDFILEDNLFDKLSIALLSDSEAVGLGPFCKNDK